MPMEQRDCRTEHCEMREICDLISNFAKHDFLTLNDLYGSCLAAELSVIGYFLQISTFGTFLAVYSLLYHLCA